MCRTGINQQDISCTLRLGMKHSDRTFWGPGVAQLLHQVAACCSLRAAAQSMDMSSSKAWKIIHDAEQALGFPLVESISGGVRGGGSRLTKQGEYILSAYDKTVSAVQETAMEAFEQNIRPVLNSAMITI